MNNDSINRIAGIAAALTIIGLLSILLAFAAGGCAEKTPFDLSSVPGPPTEFYSSPTIIRPKGF